MNYNKVISFAFIICLLPGFLFAQTPTPCACGDFLQLTDLENLTVVHTRGTGPYDLVYQLKDVAESISSWGHIFDAENKFYDKESGPGELFLRTFAHAGYGTQAGDILLITYDGGQRKRVCLPAITGYAELYVASDGSTYYDKWLSQIAQEAFPPTPTPGGYHTPTPAASPTPTPGGHKTPTPLPGCYCCTSVNPYLIILSAQFPSNGVTYDSNYDCRRDPGILYNWWTSFTDWLEVTPQQGFGVESQLYSVGISLGDTSSLSPGLHNYRLYFNEDFGCHPYVEISYYNPPPTPCASCGVTPPPPTRTPTPTPTPPPTATPTPSPTPTCAPCGFDMEGYVTDALTSSPVEGAEVFIQADTSPVRVFTSNTGYYNAFVPSCGGLVPTLMIVRAAGYYTEKALDSRGCGSPGEKDCALTPLANPAIASGDYNGDGTSDIAIFRGSTGLWAIRGVTRTYFGIANDLPVSGDYDGDSTADIAIFRPGSGFWAVRGFSRFYFGRPTGRPVPGAYGGGGASSDTVIPGDYDGDGTTEVGIFRRTNCLWAIRNLTRIYFGTRGDSPIPGDYDGDGTIDIALSRGSSGLWASRNISRLYFGSSEDTALPADYDGDGTWDYGVFRGSNCLWAVRGVTRVYLGSDSDQAVPADYDGDSAAEIGIFRPGSGLWEIMGITRTYYGSYGDIPVTR